MLSYIVTHINVLIFRKRLPNAPRKFKVPGGPIIPVLGAIGMAWMFWNISSDPAERALIYIVCLIMVAVLSVYAVLWIKKVMHRSLFKAFPMEEVMAMDNDLYAVYHDPKTGRLRANVSRGGVTPVAERDA